MGINAMRTEKSLYNLIANIFALVIPTFFSFISANILITRYGSDINGVCATINQTIGFLAVLEGGFTLATNVSLYNPYMSDDKEKVRSILSATRIAFNVIAIAFTVIVLLGSFILPEIIKSSTDKVTIIILFIMSGLTTAFYFSFEVKYRILFDVSQSEYLLSFLSTIIFVVTQILMIIFMIFHKDILYVRAILIISGIVKGLSVYILYKRHFRGYDMNVKPSFASIKSTGDVIAQKLTSVVYRSTSLLIISIFINTISASVFSVYNSIFSIIRSLVFSFTSAPSNGFGQILTNDKEGKAGSIFIIFEFIVVMLTITALTCTVVFIIPFLEIYTRNVHDANYINNTLVYLFFAAIFLEIVQVPSGIIINVTGNFKFIRNASIVFCLLNLILSFSLVSVIGIYSILWAMIISNLVLGVFEVYYTHIKILKCGIGKFFTILFINMPLSIGLIFIGYNIPMHFSGYIEFFIYAALGFILISVVTTIWNYLWFRELMSEVLSRLQMLFFSVRRRFPSVTG